MSTSKKKNTRLPAVRRADPFFARESEKYDEPLPSREYIEQVLAEQSRPMDFDALRAFFAITTEEEQHFARRLSAMERAGQLLRNRRGDYILPEKAALIRGRVEGHPDGFGFLIPEDDGDHIFLGPRAMREVLHGDRVLVQVIGKDQRGRPEGKIVEVLDRANTRVIGRVVMEQGVAIVAPENRRISQDILLAPGGKTRPQPGQVVTVELTQQPGPHSKPIGRIVETLGNYADDGMEIEIALRKHDLPFEFPADVKAEARKLPDVVRKKDLTGREDLRHLPLVTIDGETAKDFDDAVYAEKQGRGWRLLVAIADVSHYVTPGSALDREGLNRGNSVYFPRRVIPMLPEKLSNGLCSLNPEVDRLCMVCDMSISTTGEIKQYRFYPAVMYSHARLTYNRVAAALYDKDAAEQERIGALMPQLESLDAVFRILLKARAKRGAIDFETVETRMIFNEHGKIERIVPESRNDAHRVIEECMLAANVCASDFLARHEHPTLYRIHERPTPEKLEKLRAFLSEFGLTLGGGEEPKAADFARVIDEIRERPDFGLIQTVMLRSLQQAMYSPDNVGHFGLAYDAYAHFTSPIRRYPDLLVHRAIKAVLNRAQYVPMVEGVELMPDTRRVKRVRNEDGKSEQPQQRKAAKQGLWESIGVHCSMTERRADEASRDVQTWLKCFYMQDHVGSEFSGSISAATSFGIFVTLDELFVEGLVHISDLGADYFHFDEARHELVGERTGRRFRLSDRVRVQVVRVDLESRKIDFRLVEEKPGEESGKAGEKKVPGKQVKVAAKPPIENDVDASPPKRAARAVKPPVKEEEPVSWRELAGLPADGMVKALRDAGGTRGGAERPARTPSKTGASKAKSAPRTTKASEATRGKAKRRG
ncbi:ribonuclease R [Uliginosibacterium sp. H1]|uniref:ribonuclease R n=1 Tax=Uliginosibacterium sp. H1 TaxID=3114757 RepID=UPI002E1788E3|nr:ribonuclease R [Uliginosibacterium sp. H1]